MENREKQEQEEEKHGESYEQERNLKAEGNPSTAGHGHKNSEEEYAPYPKLEAADLSTGVPAHQGQWGGTWVMGSPANPDAHPVNHQAATWVAESESAAPAAAAAAAAAATPDPRRESSVQTNPYVATTSAPASSGKNSMEAVKDVLGRWGKKVGEATKMAEDLAGNVWQHLKTGPSIADTAMERLAQGTKVLTEGGYEKIFRQTFETLPEEQLQKTYTCYLSTTAGPVIGTLYLSTEKIAFCSDNPLSYKVNPDKTEWSFYKVLLPLHQFKAVNASANRTNPAEKYIQIISTDNHEFWFMGFVNYDKAVKNLQGVLKREGA